MKRIVNLALVFCLIAATSAVNAADAGSSAEDKPAHPTVLKDLGDGRLQIGLAVVDPEKRTVTFPAKVNMEEGYVEYLIVTEQGKTHESLLSTKTQPVDLHAAVLLLGVKGSPEVETSAGGDPEERQTIDAEYLQTAKLPKGDPVMLTVTWEEEGVEKTASLENWVINEKRGTPAEHGPWIYNGSEMWEGRFVAQIDGSIAALILDSFALINNPREGHGDDLIWVPNQKVMPPLEAPLKITITPSKNAKQIPKT